MKTVTMTNLAALESETLVAPSTNALRRAWQCGYDCACQEPELLRWMRDDARMEREADLMDVDLTDAAQWAGWLMGFAARMADGHVLAVAEVASVKASELY